jgi:hypothetical protein
VKCERAESTARTPQRTRCAPWWQRAAALGLLLVAATTSTAYADAPERELPDYDGRPPAPTTAEEALLWVPRILLSPLYLLSEYAVRLPLGALVSWAERSGVPEAVYDFFIFGPDHSAGVLPIAYVDFGFLPSVGLYFFWNDLIPHHDVQMRASMWGFRWLSAAVSDRIHLDPATDVVLIGRGVRRPDYQFYGLGSNSVYGGLSRYGTTRLEASAGLELKLGAQNLLTTTVGLRRVHFHPGGYEDQPSLEEAVSAGRYPTPPGYAEGGYTGIVNQMMLALDNRHARPESSSGVRLEAQVEQLTPVEPKGWPTLLRYGASLGGFWDVYDSGRVLSLSVAAFFVDPLGHGTIPFTELATIGGGPMMRGFPMGRLYGRSAVASTLRYRWPVWVWLDGSVQFAVGNVFDEHLENFAPRLLRMSTAFGVESVGASDSSFELLIGLGSETFQHGAQINSVRVTFGTNHGI